MPAGKTLIDVTPFGLRMPAEMPPVDSGEAAFDKAIAMLQKKAASQAIKPGYAELTLPARLAKPKAGDLQKILDVLTPEALDVGQSEFDMSRGGDKEYLAAWRQCVVARDPRQVFASALVKHALVPLAKGGNDKALHLLRHVEPNGEVLDVLATFLQGQIDKFGGVMTGWAHEILAAHATAEDLARFPDAIAGSVRAAQAG
jgi:hypothetical protein